MMEQTTWWGTDILVRRHGNGRLVFTHLRVLEHLGEDPVADRLFVNLLNHFSRRSVPSESPLLPDAKEVEWLRNERNQQARRWAVIGEFPNWGPDSGHDKVYPPENQIDFSATYLGWYKAVAWKDWYTQAAQGHLLDFQQAFTPIFQYYPRFDYAVAYAYAEFASDRRQDVQVDLGLQNATKVWMNGRLIHESKTQVPHDRFERESTETYIKQGKNTVLVKCSKIPGPFRFSFDFQAHGKEALQLNWWR